MAAVSSHHTHVSFPRSSSAAPQKPKPGPALRAIPREVIAMVGTAFGILIAVGSGSLLAAQVPENSPWLFMAAYAAPAAVVFAIFWLISRRL
ncbi:hypothetical protein [Phenylobacterium montanum]|uniref:Uncharacterized protein n=1 Tax=Phenylobacterium montanum TaxID=2823693 RepID=A0A975FZT7_9CAUL|nr:hypothetical protein [Caulobacter sp. S6]QUD88174.1 hypothetical protein KCG34_24630 [Caulobacter sp. S6]